MPLTALLLTGTLTGHRILLDSQNWDKMKIKWIVPISRLDRMQHGVIKSVPIDVAGEKMSITLTASGDELKIGLEAVNSVWKERIVDRLSLGVEDFNNTSLQIPGFALADSQKFANTETSLPFNGALQSGNFAARNFDGEDDGGPLIHVEAEADAGESAPCDMTRSSLIEALGTQVRSFVITARFRLQRMSDTVVGCQDEGDEAGQAYMEEEV